MVRTKPSGKWSCMTERKKSFTSAEYFHLIVDVARAAPVG
jgi:hypothetical protein